MLYIETNVSEASDISDNIPNNRNSRFVKVGIYVLIWVALMLAWYNRFVQDDAFISFTYAKNWVNGNGLTWFGDRVEGYTNFLWVAFMAIPEFLKMDSILFSQILGIWFYFLTMLFAIKIYFSIFGKQIKSLLSLLFLVTNYSVICYATGGLETSLQTCLLTVVFYLLILKIQAYNINRICFFASIISTLAVMTRLDSVIILLPVFLLFTRKNKLYFQNYLALLVPFFATISTWFIIKYSYYGSILPNSFYAKTGAGLEALANGFLYVARFLHWYMLWPFILGWLIVAIVKRETINQSIVSALGIVLVWFAYIAFVGGDFMEFRFIVPVTPLLFLLVVEALDRISEIAGSLKNVILVAGVIVVLSFSYHHASAFTGIMKSGSLDSIQTLKTFYNIYPQEEWGKIGKKLKTLFNGKNYSLALRPVGAIAYYSDLKVYDMWGINDKYVARHGVKLPQQTTFRPGHVRTATLSYLLKSKVDILLEHPTLISRGIVSDPRAKQFLVDWATRSKTAEDIETIKRNIFVIPLSDKVGLLALNLSNNPNLNMQIKSLGWEHCEVSF